MGERITFRRNEGLITVKPYWRGNPVVKGRFVNRQHRSKQGIGNILKWRFSPNPRMKVFCGLGMRDLIRGWLPDIQVIEAGWHQRWEEERLKITFLPARHWSTCSLNDGGLRLWGAFMLQTDADESPDNDPYALRDIRFIRRTP